MSEDGVAAGWLVGMLAAGVAGVAVTRATTVWQEPEALWYSSLFRPALVALVLLCAVGGYCVPARWLGLGLAAGAPYFVIQLSGYVSDHSDPIVLKLTFALLLGGILIGVARLGAVYREDRERITDRLPRNWEGVGWLLGMLAAGTAAVFGTLATAAEGTGGDIMDSSLFFPLLSALGALCAVAGYRIPASWLAFGAAATVPYYLVLGLNDMEEDDMGLVRFVFLMLLVLVLIPISGARLGVTFRRGRERRVGR